MCSDLERIERAVGKLRYRLLDLCTDLEIDVETAADLLEGVLESIDGGPAAVQDVDDVGELAEVEAAGKWWYWR